jgi:hypothetical protein
VGFPPVFLTLRKVVHGGLAMCFSKGVLLKLKPAFNQAAEKPAVGYLKSLRFHRDQRVEKVKAYGSNLVHHLLFIAHGSSSNDRGQGVLASEHRLNDRALKRFG